MADLVRLSHVVSAASSSEEGRIPSLLQLGISSTRDSPLQVSVMWILPRSCSFSLTAPAWVPLRVISSASKSAAMWSPLIMAPQVLPGVCSSVGSPQGHSLLQASTCLSVGSATLSHSCRGTAFLTLGCSTWRTSSPTFFTDFGVFRVVLTYSSLAAICFYAITSPGGMTTIADWLSLGQPWSVLELPGIGWM